MLLAQVRDLPVSVVALQRGLLEAGEISEGLFGVRRGRGRGLRRGGRLRVAPDATRQHRRDSQGKSDSAHSWDG